MADFKQTFNEFNNTADYTAEYEEADVKETKNVIMSILAYLGILVLIPIFAAKNSKFCRFHSNQGLVLLIPELFVSIVLGVLGRIPFIGWLFNIINGLCALVFLCFVVIGIINVVNGKAKDLPIIGKYRILK